MEMINHIHSILRWAILILLVMTIAKAFMGMQRKTAFTNGDDKSSLMLMIVADSQLLLGLVLYIFGALGIKNIQNQGMGEVMKNSYARFFAMEHILMMLIAIVLIHVGRSRTKKAVSDEAKHKLSFWFYLIALLLILASIPWPFRAGFEMRGWM